MLFDYFHALSGAPIFIEGVGHFHSPKLHQLIWENGFGLQEYIIYLRLLSWDKEQLLEYKKMKKHTVDGRLLREQVSAYDIITLTSDLRGFYARTLSFFMSENEEVVWDEKRRHFAVIIADEDGHHPCGVIDRQNFEYVRKLILQLNFVGINSDETPVEHSNEKTKELWEQVQGYLREQSKKQSGEEKPEYHISNIGSKLCAAHPSYNLLNVYELTVFQLYDAFFQVSYLRGADLNERIFSNHGGEKFKFEHWLKPILKIT